MARNQKPTIAVGCGAHHIPYHYRFFESTLKDVGYEVKIVQLPSTSPVVIEDAMTKDVQVIRQAVQDAISEGQEVVVVLHSWSGFAGCAALEGLEEHVKGVVFLASWLQESGKGSCEWLGVDEIGIYDDGLNHVKDPMEKFYNDVPSDLAQDSLEYLLPMVNSVTKTPLAFPPIWEKVPCTYVICDEDEAIPPGFAEMMIQGCGLVEGKGRVVRMGGAHSPFLTEKVQMLAGIVRRMAGEDVGMEGVRVDGERIL